MHVIGQKLNLEIIDKWQDMPNFIIVQGDDNTGRTHLVTYMCEKFGKHYHLVGNSVQNVRELIKLMVEGSNTVFHFKDFDKASLVAKNALLKITEEPVAGNYIVITGSSQLQTLESRARRLHMAQYDFGELKPLLTKHYESIDARKLFNAGFNTPSKILFYKSYEGLNGLLDFAYEIYGRITYIGIEDILKIMSMFEPRYSDIDAVELFLSMLISIIEYNIREKLGLRYSHFDILDFMLYARELLKKEPTLNRKMLLYRTFHNIMLLGGSR